MPYVSVFGNSNTPSSNTSNNSGAYQSVFGNNTTWTNTQPSSSNPQPIQQPAQQNQSKPLLSGIGDFLGGVANIVQSWFTASGGQPTPVKLTTSQVSQIQQAPVGLKVGQKIPNYTPPTNSAQATKSANNIFDTSNYFPGVLDTLSQLAIDPLNLQVDPKKALQDAANTVVSAVAQENIRWSDFLKTANSNAPVSAKIGSGLQVVTGAANYAFSPISAFFNAANDIPVVGTASKLITLPFTVAGEGATDISNGIIDKLPIPPQIKTNLKPAIGEIAALAAQLALGKISFVDEATTAKLTKKYGAQDAATIIDQAKNAAETHPTDGTLNVNPTQATTLVTKSNLQNTPAGREILKNAAIAQQSGDNLVISITPKDGIVPEGSPLNVKTPGGATITDIQLGQPLDQIAAEPTAKASIIEPSILQSVDTKTGQVSYQTIPKGQLDNFHSLVDETSHGVAGKDLNGQIYHLTAKTPEQMDATGAKFIGEANVADLQSKVLESLKTIKTPDDKILNPILAEIDKQLNGRMESNGTSQGQENLSTETKAVQSENSGNQDSQASNTQENHPTELSNQPGRQDSQNFTQSGQPTEGQSNAGSNQGVERVNGRSEPANPTRSNPTDSGNSVSRTTRSGQGLKVSKIAKEIEAKAVESKITDKFSQLAGYEPITVKEQSRLATDLVNNHFEDAQAIVKGEKPLPVGLKGTSLITAMEEHLAKNPDPQTLMDLAKSKLITGTSQAAQELRLAAERDPYSPLSIIKQLQDDRKAVIEKQYSESVDHVIKKEVTKGSEQIDRQVRSNSGSKSKLADFIKGIQC